MAAKVRGDQKPHMRPTRHLTIACLVLTAITSAALGRTSTYVNWESPQTHSVEVTPNGATLLVVNTPDNRLEVFDVAGSTFNRRGSVSVGLDPVSVRARSNTTLHSRRCTVASLGRRWSDLNRSLDKPWCQF
jgi:DNA-binding beta-propeller fold protein YncE